MKSQRELKLNLDDAEPHVDVGEHRPVQTYEILPAFFFSSPLSGWHIP